MKRLTPEQKLSVRMLATGNINLTNEDIAALFGVSYNTFVTITKGVKRSKDPAFEMKKLYVIESGRDDEESWKKAIAAAVDFHRERLADLHRRFTPVHAVA